MVFLVSIIYVVVIVDGGSEEDTGHTCEILRYRLSFPVHNLNSSERRGMSGDKFNGDFLTFDLCGTRVEYT